MSTLRYAKNLLDLAFIYVMAGTFIVPIFSFQITFQAYYIFMLITKRTRQ